MKKWLLVIAANLALVAVLLAFVEFGLRFTSFDAVRNPPAGNPTGYYVADDELGIRIAPNFPPERFEFRGPGHLVFSNALGCFDHPVNLRPNERYILAIGDSFTWGYNPLEAKWTSIIERRTGTRVLKCGVPGTGTKYHLGRLQRLLARLPHPPETVIHLYDTTDFNDDFTFPAETVIDGRRVENYERVRLRDGRQLKAGPRGTLHKRGQLYARDIPAAPTGSVLGGIVKMGLTLDDQLDRREAMLAGAAPRFLLWRYDFNLLLLDPGEYPFVAGKLDEHIATLREVGETARDAGARYLLFHTSSFRLPREAPLVRKFEREFDLLPGFRGRLPELGRHIFDPHWNAESELKVAEFMLERLDPHHLLSDRATGRSLR